MKCQILFSWKNKKNIIILSAEFAHSMVSVNPCPAEPRYTLPFQTVKKPAVRFGSALFVIQYVNFYQQFGSSLIG